MIFSELMATYVAYNATKKIKRFITGAKIVFGKNFVVPVLNIKIPAPAPVNNRLRIYNSFLDMGAERDTVGQPQYLDTKTYSELNNVILEPSVLKDLMEYNGNPYDYILNRTFRTSAVINGQRKYFQFNHRQMLMIIDFTPDFETFKKFQAAAAYEKTCQQWVLLAQRNSRALAALGLKTNLTAQQKSALSLEITKHMHAVNDFKSKLPPGFYLDTKKLKADQIGALPVIAIIWIVGLIVAGIAVPTVYYFSRQADIESLKASLDARYKSIMSISDIQIRDEALVDAANSDNKVLENQSTDTGMLGQVKQIALIIGGALVLKEVLPLLTKKSKS